MYCVIEKIASGVNFHLPFYYTLSNNAINNLASMLRQLTKSSSLGVQLAEMYSEPCQISKDGSICENS